MSPVPPEDVLRIVRFPEADFISLTGCGKWRNPLIVDRLRFLGPRR
jgi:hypothetical protein